MAQTCTRCSRVNPDEACYCYYDGSVLAGHAANGGPVNSGTQPFQNPFVFPSGQSARNFDQFALACQEHWAEAVGLLHDGLLGSFLGGLGRADLALAAREAVKFPDRDRGLDQLLAKLPSEALEQPKLFAEPTEVSLGQLKPGENREIELHLTNQGMRLLYGSVTCENCDWLALGDKPGGPQKHFQFRTDQAIPLHVNAKNLRASSKPIEGRLTIESNGGSTSITVKAEMPIRPFPEGTLAGAKSPRQLAEKAKANAKGAAALFEKGAVEKWYKDNGWPYPVKGELADGLGAVQQFFEALGLTPPPKVEISTKSVAFSGMPGDRELIQEVEVKTQEKRPVYAYAECKEDWLKVGRAKLSGRTATIPLIVPSVPQRSGETLKARVTVTANGNQRFVVPVTLVVGSDFSFVNSPAAPVAPVEEAKAPEPLRTPEPAAAAPVASAKRKSAPGIKLGVPGFQSKDLIHAVPLLLLALALGVVTLVDVFGTATPVVVRPDDGQKGGISKGGIEAIDLDPRIQVRFTEQTKRFGITMTREMEADGQKAKRLTSEDDGRNNNTCIKIDGNESLFGQQPGEWVREKGKSLRFVTIGSKNNHWKSTWEWEKVWVTQEVQIVVGEQTRLYDTCLVRYIVDNKDTVDHQVGLRVLLDTFIGANDGVPFQIPGESKLMETLGKYREKDIPDFLQAMEKADPKDPGTVAQLGLKLANMEPIVRMLICRWPGSGARWEWEAKAMNDPPDEKKDSCVAFYWDYAKMKPGDRREMGFTYGLGKVSGAGGRIGLAYHGKTQPDGIFTVTAFIKSPDEGQKVSITLPDGLSLDAKEKEEKAITTVEKGKDGLVAWRIKAHKEGEFAVEVATGSAKEKLKVQINKGSIFN